MNAKLIAMADEKCHLLGFVQKHLDFASHCLQALLSDVQISAITRTFITLTDYTWNLQICVRSPGRVWQCTTLPVVIAYRRP